MLEPDDSSAAIADALMSKLCVDLRLQGEGKAAVKWRKEGSGR